MPDRATIGLDNPTFQGRLRQSSRMHLFTDTRARHHPLRRSPALYRGSLSDIRANNQRVAQPAPTGQKVFFRPDIPRASPEIVQPQPFAEPAQARQQPSNVLKRLAVKFPELRNRQSNKNFPRLGRVQFGLIGMAAVVFILGIFSSLQTIKTNHNAAAQVAALSRKANNSVNTGNGAVPSTTKPSPAAVSDYIVAPNLPRYLKIPKLGVDARVLQVGVTSTGALGTPPNVFDTAWYTGSAEPGQPGATLIDGHVSSWTSHGVFYGLKTLVAGDQIQIVRGDGAIFNYQVVKTQVYSAGNVNMQAAMTPITAGKSGLNLITCTGDVIPGTSLFNERIIVFAQQV